VTSPITSPAPAASAPPDPSEYEPRVLTETLVTTLRTELDTLKTLGERTDSRFIVAAAKRWRVAIDEAPNGAQARAAEFQFQTARFGHSIIGALNQFDGSTPCKQLDIGSQHAVLLVVDGIRQAAAHYTIPADAPNTRVFSAESHAALARDMLRIHKDALRHGHLLVASSLSNVLSEIRTDFGVALNGAAYGTAGFEDAKTLTLRSLEAFKNNPLMKPGAAQVLELAAAGIHAADFTTPIRVGMLPPVADGVVQRMSASSIAESVAASAAAVPSAPAMGV
jgi:hypothetical protein